jgi:hypothetical protein
VQWQNNDSTAHGRRNELSSGRIRMNTYSFLQ